MRYGDNTNLIAPYLRPMYLPAIEGIKDAQTQGRWEQVQDEEKRRWEANRPFVDAQAKQMQFAAKKAEEAGKAYDWAKGGSGNAEFANFGMDPKEVVRSYLGVQNKDPEIEADIPGIGKTRISVSKYLDFLTRQKQPEQMATVMFEGKPIQIPAKDAYHFLPKPPEKPQYERYDRIGPDGKPYAEIREKRPGIVPDIYKPQSERGGYTQGQMIDDNLSYYGFKSKALIDPTNGRVIKGKESEYQQLLSDYQNDLKKIAEGQKPTWLGGTSAEQDKDNAFLDQIRQALGGQPAPDARGMGQR